jgi:hypothetical protein
LDQIGGFTALACVQKKEKKTKNGRNMLKRRPWHRQKPGLTELTLTPDAAASAAAEFCSASRACLEAQ